jgi:Sulfatase
MDGCLQVAVGSALALAGWLLPRRVAGVRGAGWPALLVDLLPVLLASALLLIATGRPVFSGAVVLALGAGLALADAAKRETLREPVVFSDMSELPHVFTHPHLYLPFAGTGLVLGSGAAAAAAGVALLALEPRLFALDPGLVLLDGLAVLALWLIGHEPLLGGAAAALRRLDPTGEPLEDAARLGPFAALFAYGVIARAERPARRARHPPLPAPFLGGGEAAAPVVLVQCESFFDARRLSPNVPAGLLPGFERCRSGALAFGRLDVGAWGANTMRAEFAVLTGIAECQLGYDRFNPYHALARAPLASLARDFRAHGYRTLCLHPFDRGFFRRDEVLPKLGFDAFFGRERLGGGRRPPYFADPDLARAILEVVAREGPRVFVFAITMGNHGPWHEGEPAPDAAAQWFDAAAVPQGRDLARYLDGLRRSDEMLDILVDGFEGRGRDAVLAFYGDHLPSLPGAFAHFGFDDWSSDWLLWPGAGEAPRRIDLPAHRLPKLVKDVLRNRQSIHAPVSDTVFVDGAS